jgi:AraC-like DNA-binding protein
MRSPTVPQCEASTDEAPAHQRLAFWEAHNASELIGLQCTSHAADGLAARERNFDLGPLRLADIAGNEHVIERTPSLARRYPKDSVFMALLVEGDAFFYQRGRCLTAQPGDVLIYTTAEPYLCGFGRHARQWLVDLPPQFLYGDGARCALSGQPVKIAGALRGERTLAGDLHRTLRGFAAQPLVSHAPHVADRVRALCRAMLAPHRSVRAGESAQVRRLQAEAFIAERLGDHDLTATAVARYVCMSLRHLNRLFEASDCTATQWIWQQRLAAASRLLADPAQHRLSMGDVGFRCGFATAAHFSAAFKVRYGMTPSHYRQGVGRITEGVMDNDGSCGL